MVRFHRYKGGIEMAHPDEDLTRTAFAAAVPEVVIKLAETAAEREQIYGLRYQTYVAEFPEFSSVADHVRRRLTDEHDEHSWLLSAYEGEQLVGTMRLTFGAD